MQNEKYEAPLNIYISSSYDDAELAQKFLSDYVKGFGITVDKQRNGDELYVTIDGLDEDIDALVSVYTAQYDEFKKDCKAEPSGWVSPVNFEKSKEDESMKSESNIEDLRDQTISWGTMRSEDLIPKFLGVLKTYAKDKYDEYVNENPEVLDIDGLDDETLGWIVDELFDKLDEIAPEGTYFGAHPDDGADYGFWSVDESKKKESLYGRPDSEKDELAGKYYVDIENDSEGTIYSSEQEFNDYASAEEWANSELEKNVDDEDVFQASIYKMFVDTDTEQLDSDLEGTIHKSDVCESKKSESLTLKQAELKKMAKYGEAEDITGLSDAEAKELKKSGVELVGISRGTYGMNGALMRGTADGKLYVITSRNSNLFYFV